MSAHGNHGGHEPLPPSWFERNARGIVRGLLAVCVGLLIADVVFTFVGHKHVHFAIEAWPGFYAAAGFISYVGLILVAKQLRKLVMRPVDYYGEAVPEPKPPEPAPQPQQRAAEEHGRTPVSTPPPPPPSKSESLADSESEWDTDSHSETDSRSDSDSDEPEGSR